MKGGSGGDVFFSSMRCARCDLHKLARLSHSRLLRDILAKIQELIKEMVGAIEEIERKI